MSLRLEGTIAVRHGTEVVAEWKDDERYYYDYLNPDNSRPYTPEENAAADESLSEAARLDDIRARLERLERAVFGEAPDEPTSPDDPSVKDWAAWGGVVPAGGLLLDVDGVVYRNVTDVPLTTPPSGFPGAPARWRHLWLPVLGEPDDPGADAEPWAAGVAYEVGDSVTYEGTVYTCIQAHTSQVGWEPNVVPALWDSETIGAAGNRRRPQIGR